MIKLSGLTLENGSGGQEALDIGRTEGVGAGLDRAGASGGQALGQEVDVGGLVRADSLDVVVESRVVTGGSKVGLGVVGKTLLVEGVLQVLEGKSILKDVGISGGRCALLSRSGSREASKGSDGGGVLHFDDDVGCLEDEELRIKKY